jgi:hypothetical protein
VLEVTGGELVPPEPGSAEYKALPSGADRAKASAFWDKQPAEDEEPAEQMRAALEAKP